MVVSLVLFSGYNLARVLLQASGRFFFQRASAPGSFIPLSLRIAVPIAAIASLGACTRVPSKPEYLNSGKILSPNLPFSEAVKVGNQLILSGQLGNFPGSIKLAPGGIRPDSRQVIENIKTTLEAYDYSLRDVVKCTVVLADINECAAFNVVYQTRWEKGAYPARSAFGYSGLTFNARVDTRPALEGQTGCGGATDSLHTQTSGGRMQHRDDTSTPNPQRRTGLLATPNRLGRWAIAGCLAFATALPGLLHATDTEGIDTEFEQKVNALGWHRPGQVGDIAGKATFAASKRYTFLDSQDTAEFLELNGNPPQHTANTVASVHDDWFAILTYLPEGYVKDDEKIDADALLKQLKDNNAREAEQRRKKGYPVLTLTDWAIPPRYDEQNKRLEWGTLLRNADTEELHVNVTTKVLGRGGYTNVVLVTSPDTAEKDLADFKKAMGDFQYVAGEKYSDWKPGDKVAAYGLSALVLGGAAAVATSKGGLKAAIIALMAGFAGLWAAAKQLLARRRKP